MSTITRGAVAGLLLAGAVAGAAAFPRFLAGPAGTETPSLAVVPAASPPAIVRAHALPAPPATRRRLPVALVQVRALPHAPAAQPPVVVHPVAKPVQIAAKPAPAPSSTPPPPPAPIRAPSPAPPPASTAQAQTVAAPSPPEPVRLTASAAPPTAPAPAPPPSPAQPSSQQSQSDGGGDGNPANPCQGGLGSNDHGARQQAPSGTVGYGSAPVGRVEAPHPYTAPSDHGHGAPPWAHGGGEGH